MGEAAGMSFRKQLRRNFKDIARNATTRTSHSLETSVTFPLHVLHVLLREPTVVQTLI